MDGILNVDKSSGPTSHDVVARLRKALRMKRIGHAGTLDPSASGVLVVCVGNATRIAEYLVDWRKAYQAEAVFGAETDSQDESGSVLRETDCSHLTRESVEAVLARFVGRIQQVPPMLSAVHHKGRRLYELARAGEVVERAPRSVAVYSLRLADFNPGVRSRAVLDVECSKGTYIRTLCADIGRALDCGGYMSSLVRTAVGRFGLADAVTVETVEEKASAGRLGDILHPIDEVLEEMPSAKVSDADAHRVANGVAVPTAGLLEADGDLAEDAPVRIHGADGRLLAIARLFCLPGGGMAVKPEKVFVKPG